METTTSTGARASSATISLLEKKYTINYPENTYQDLEKAAKLLNNKMQEAKNLGKHYDAEQAAIIAGLNLAHELLTMIETVNQEEQEPMPNDNLNSLNTLPEELELADDDEIEFEAYDESDYEDDEDEEYDDDDDDYEDDDDDYDDDEDDEDDDFDYDEDDEDLEEIDDIEEEKY